MKRDRTAMIVAYLIRHYLYSDDHQDSFDMALDLIAQEELEERESEQQQLPLGDYPPGVPRS